MTGGVCSGHRARHRTGGNRTWNRSILRTVSHAQRRIPWRSLRGAGDARKSPLRRVSDEILPIGLRGPPGHAKRAPRHGALNPTDTTSTAGWRRQVMRQLADRAQLSQRDKAACKRARAGRGHAVRSRLHLALFRQQPVRASQQQRCEEIAPSSSLRCALWPRPPLRMISALRIGRRSCGVASGAAVSKLPSNAARRREVLHRMWGSGTIGLRCLRVYQP